jgi:hypothetical protein
MGFKLGDISPVVGMATGEGITGNLIRQGVGGVLPMMIARNAYDSKKDEENKRLESEAKAKAAAEAAKDEETSVKTMKKGGKVSSASKRADGIAQRGKTRGRMI